MYELNVTKFHFFFTIKSRKKRKFSKKKLININTLIDDLSTLLSTALLLLRVESWSRELRDYYAFLYYFFKILCKKYQIHWQGVIYTAFYHFIIPLMFINIVVTTRTFKHLFRYSNIRRLKHTAAILSLVFLSHAQCRSDKYTDISFYPCELSCKTLRDSSIPIEYNYINCDKTIWIE